MKQVLQFFQKIGNAVRSKKTQQLVLPQELQQAIPGRTSQGFEAGIKDIAGEPDATENEWVTDVSTQTDSEIANADRQISNHQNASHAPENAEEVVEVIKQQYEHKTNIKKFKVQKTQNKYKCRLKRVKEKKAEAEIALNQISEKNIPSTESSKGKSIFYIVLLCLIAIVEVPMMVTMMRQLISMPAFMIALMAAAASALLACSCHFATKYYQRKKYGSASFSFLAAILVTLLQIFLRHNLPFITQLIMGLFSIALLGFAWVAGVYGNEFVEYFGLKHRIERYDTEIDDLEVKIEDFSLDIKIIDAEDALQAIIETGNAVKATNTSRLNNQNNLLGLIAYKNSLVQKKQAYITYGKNLIRSAYNKGRAKTSSPFDLGRNAALNIILATVLAGCAPNTKDKPSEPVSTTSDNIEFYITKDVSNSAENVSFQSAESIITFFKKTIGINKGVVWNGVRIYIAKIGAPSFGSEVITIELPQGEQRAWLQDVKGRQDEVDSFISRLEYAVQTVFNAPLADNVSQISRGLASQTQYLVKSNWSTDKRFYIFSDLAQANGVVNFSSYKSLSKFSSDSLRIEDVLEKDFPTCDLSSIKEINIVGSPTINSDAYLRYAHWWKFHFRRHGCKEINIIAALN